VVDIPAPITDPQLLDRLGMAQERFLDSLRSLLEKLPAREYEAKALARAVEYPFDRPQGSFRLCDDAIEPLEELGDEEREATIARFAEAADRHPVLAIGSNGSPQVLSAKFAHFAEGADREVLVLTGRLHDFDAGAAPQPALYGSMPATIFPSPGTRMRAAVLWVTPAQFTQLAWSELSYRLGRLRTRFEVELGESQFAEVHVFVSRFGAFSPDGSPVAMAAIPANARSAEELTQEQLLDAVAVLALGPEASAEDLIRAIHEDLESVALEIAARAWPQATPFESPLWQPFSP
jgi:hypothetical protein